jgi:hypothetical protein
MSTMICERCGTAPGAAHTFHYGRTAPVDDRFDDPPEATESTAEHPTGTVYHASAYLTETGAHEAFQVGGIEAVALCEHCLRKARRHRAARLLLEWVRMPLVVAGYGALVIGIVAWASAGNWVQAAIWLGVGLVVTAIAYAVAYMALEDEDFAQHTAVDVHAERLREQGWDQFWTDNEFAHLAPH